MLVGLDARTFLFPHNSSPGLGTAKGTSTTFFGLTFDV